MGYNRLCGQTRSKPAFQNNINSKITEKSEQRKKTAPNLIDNQGKDPKTNFDKQRTNTSHPLLPHQHHTTRAAHYYNSASPNHENLKNAQKIYRHARITLTLTNRKQSVAKVETYIRTV